MPKRTDNTTTTPPDTKLTIRFDRETVAYIKWAAEIEGKTIQGYLTELVRKDNIDRSKKRPDTPQLES